jgi:sec-independent protein translocase protein TatC
MELRLKRRRAKRESSGTMPLMEHLIELRRRLLISFAAIGLCAIVVFIFYNPVLHFLSGPYRQVTANTPGCPKSGCDLIVTDPLAPFLVRLKIAGYGGLALSVPIVMWEIWRFIVPGLHQRERRYAVGFLVSAIVLFLLGCVVAWFTVTKALSFLLGVGGHSLRPLIDANKYLTLVMLMFAAFGFAFQFPLLLVFLMLVGVVNTRQLRSTRRWAAVGITTFAAIITPSQDPFSLLFMAVPMYIFYEGAILVGRMMKR